MSEHGMATQVMPGPAKIPPGGGEQTGWVRHGEQGVRARLRKEGLPARRLVPPCFPCRLWTLGDSNNVLASRVSAKLPGIAVLEVLEKR